MRILVLALGAEANAVGEDGFEAVIVHATDIGVAVDDETCEMLADSLTHDAGFAMMDAEAFVVGDGCYMCGEAFGMSIDSSSGEGEIVGVSRVDCSDRLREAGEAAVHAESTEVGERG